MAQLELGANEIVILRSENVKHGDKLLSMCTDELVLTNENICLIQKGTFGKIKNIIKWPLRKIKIFDNRAQALLGKDRNGNPRLEIYFVDGQEHFMFNTMSKKRILEWVDEINSVVIGDEYKMASNGTRTIPGAEFVASTIKDTMDTFKSVFSKKTKEEIEELKISRFCTSCGARINGIKGKQVFCQYCGNGQKLE